VIEFELKRSGILFVVSAPSGGGKSTIIRELLANDATLSYSISGTTRAARSDEQEGREYYFYSIEDFQRLIDEDRLYEYALVHGNYYGTLKSEVDSKLHAGGDVILDLDVQGSVELKKKAPECVSIFILPPSLATLEKRLRGRGSDEEETIQRRLLNARTELRMAERYDYVLVNRVLTETIEQMKTIIAAERFRASRLTVRDSLGSLLVSAGSEA